MITRLEAGNPGAFTGPSGNNTWLVDGAAPLLVDAGVGEPSHLDALRRALGARPLARVFVTHAHHDHAAGVPRLREAWPGLQVTGGRDGVSADDGAWIPAGDGRLQIIATPGHSPDHACLWDPEHRMLFGGDLLIEGGTIMIAASSGGSLRTYLESLRRVQSLEPARVYPGHGPVIEDPAALIAQYLSHRESRERQVVDALGARPSSIADLIDVVYPALDGALRGAASETLLAHLRKLEEEHRAREDEGTWSLL